MQIITSQSSKTDAHNVDDSSKRHNIKSQVHPEYANDAERRRANSKAREQQNRFNGR